MTQPSVSSRSLVIWPHFTDWWDPRMCINKCLSAFFPTHLCFLCWLSKLLMWFMCWKIFTCSNSHKVNTEIDILCHKKWVTPPLCPPTDQTAGSRVVAMKWRSFSNFFNPVRPTVLCKSLESAFISWYFSRKIVNSCSDILKCVQM